MTAPSVVHIFVTPEEGGPVEARNSVIAVAGRGLEGDHYFADDSVPPEKRDPTLEITLIALEGIEAAAEESGLDIVPADARRNIVTSGVDLGALLGARFKVGEVEVEAMEDNPACSHLQKLAGKKLLKSMVTRGGVRGRIVTGGTIRTGDPITL